MEINNLDLKKFLLDEIESIELIGESDTVDISVEDTHMFFANDIYTHNSSLNADVVQANQMGGSIKKGQIGHFIVSIAKTPAQKENGTATMAILKSRFGKDGIVFNDITFNNSTIQIELDNVTNGKTFFEQQTGKTASNQEKMAQVMEAIRKRKEAMNNNTDTEVNQNNNNQ